MTELNLTAEETEKHPSSYCLEVLLSSSLVYIFSLADVFTMIKS